MPRRLSLNPTDDRPKPCSGAGNAGDRSHRRRVPEDCVFLNIYLPPGKATSHRGDQASERPVMVWLHGGGFSSGQGSAYDPKPLVRENVVVVSINYRLGALG